jgi:hypothetical protein
MEVTALLEQQSVARVEQVAQVVALAVAVAALVQEQ